MYIPVIKKYKINKICRSRACPCPIKVLFLILSFICAATCFGQETQKQDKEPVYKNLSFNKNTGIISYELTTPMKVRIRVGIAEGPLYRTICDWEERGTGKHEETWDGMDTSKIFKITGRNDLVFTFNYFTEGDEYISDIQTFDFQTPAGNNIGRHLPNLQVNQLHKDHIPSSCRDIEVKVSLPRNTPRTKDNFYIIKDKAPIEISLGEEDKNRFRAERYTLHIFMDDIFIRGELDGYTPYTWIFDPKGLNEGKHLIVVNLAGFSDHYGIGSLPIIIQKTGRK